MYKAQYKGNDIMLRVFNKISAMTASDETSVSQVFQSASDEQPRLFKGHAQQQLWCGDKYAIVMTNVRTHFSKFVHHT